MSERRAPVQGVGKWSLPLTHSAREANAKPPGTISWAEHLAVWEAYAARFPGQSAERIAERGGFGYGEIRMLLGRDAATFETLPAYARHEVE